MTIPPPPPPSLPRPAPDRPTPRRPLAVWLLAALSILLAVALVAVSLAWRHERNRVDELEAAPTAVPAPTAPEPTTPEPTAPVPSMPEPSDRPGLGLDDVLDGLTGGLGEAFGGLDGVSPTCLGLDGGLAGLGGLLDSEPLTGTLDEQLRELAQRVAAQRGLTFDADLAPVLLDPEEFDARVAAMVRSDYPAEEAELDSRVLGLLGAIPAGTDLRALQADLLAGQVAGFYDPETGEIVVRDDGDPDLDTSEVLTLAHELDHALTDQALGLPDLDADQGRSLDTDADLAALALVEGDATLLMQQYTMAYVGLVDQLGQLMDPQAASAQAELVDLAPYLREQLTFPYLTGLSYACRLFEQGGWPAIDAAYDDPPATTADVLFADRATTGAVDPADPGTLAAPWSLARRDTLGAAQLLWLFTAPGGDESRGLAEAEEQAARWAGGELALWTDGDRSALGVALVDTASDGGLCAAVDEWYGASFDDDRRSATGGEVVFAGGAQTAVLRCDGTDVRLGIGPDEPTAAALAS